MATWAPDSTFYPSPTMAMVAPRETLGYVAILNPDGSNGPDALGGSISIRRHPPTAR